MTPSAPVYTFETLSVFTFKTFPCVPAASPHVSYMWAWCRYTRGRFESTHGKRSERVHGVFSRFFPRAATHQTDTTTTNNTTTTTTPPPQRHTPHNTTRRQKQRETEKERQDKTREDETRQEGKRREEKR